MCGSARPVKKLKFRRFSGYGRFTGRYVRGKQAGLYLVQRVHGYYADRGFDGKVTGHSYLGTQGESDQSAKY